MPKPDDNIPSMLRIPHSVNLSRKKKRFLTFNRSLLARKIIMFNLVALGVLVAGVLYLSQADEGRVSQRRDDMLQQAEILAAAISAQPVISEAYFTSLAKPISSIVRLYDADGNLIMQQLPNAITGSEGAKAQADNTDFLTDVLQTVWQALSGPSEVSGLTSSSLLARFNTLVANAIEQPNQTQRSTFTSSGDLFISVAAPIVVDGKTDKVILISTLGGEIDAVIRQEREQILQIFVLAILTSIVLSMVLANSIARPLRRLADAADMAYDSAGQRLNPALIQIPDLTARPDEIGDLSRAMRQMIEALFERIDLNKNFAADVAHEIKNPLTSLRSAVETLGYPLEEEERVAMLGIIRGDVDRLNRLVTDISNASRLDGELVHEQWAPVDLDKLLKNHVEHYASEWPNVKISLESGNEKFEVFGLDGRLSQVFDNLITNALDFIPEHGWLKISLDYDGPDMIEIRFTDNGPGIPADNLNDVFERFYSERPEAQFGDHSGLGLAICKQIIEAHNGTISVRNVSTSGGAQFLIRLPV